MSTEANATEILKLVVLRLGEVADDLTFIGGATISLYLTEPQVVKVRATLDVDTVVEVTNHLEYEILKEKLRKKKFTEKPEEKVICRFFNGDLILDVMPDDSKILGFSNRWYKDAMRSRIQFRVSDRNINAFSAVYLLATKMEAFLGRGKNDFYGSHDMEDIVNLFDGRSGLSLEISKDNAEVSQWIRETLSKWLRDRDFSQAIEGHISDRQNSAGRRDIVEQRMKRACLN